MKKTQRQALATRILRRAMELDALDGILQETVNVTLAITSREFNDQVQNFRFLLSEEIERLRVESNELNKLIP